jgi:TRAP-type C4-dicarboxylate transport system permease small subunit
MERLPGRALAGLDALARTAIVVTFTGMVATVSAQVLLRYVFNDSIDWAEDLARLLFVWTIFLAIPLGVRTGVHIGVTLLVAALPGPLQRGLQRATALAGLALMAVVAWGAVSLLPEQWDEMLPTLPWSVGWMLVPVAIGAAHSALHLAGIAWRGPPPDAALSAE